MSIMETAGASISLKSELKGLIQAIHRDKRLTCSGKTPQEKRCGRPLNKSTREKLVRLVEDILELLKNNGEGVETLLEKVSLLVMCVPYHQDQAAAKFKEWLGRLPTRNHKLADGGARAERSLSKEQKSGSRNGVEIRQFDQKWSLEPAHSLFETDFEDSGFQSGSEDDLFYDKGTALRKTKTVALSSSAEYAAPRTPRKPAKLVSIDSGISMSFDNTDKAQKKRSVRYRNGLESPLTGKASRARRAIAGTSSRRPAPTPVQHLSLPIRTKRNFAPFHDPFIKMKNYINKPLLAKEDAKEEYIYGFQVEGYAYTKIGYAVMRDTEPTLEADFDARMKEHQDADWPDLQVVLKVKVHHAQRMEKIIHYHLEAGRMRERFCSCDGSSEEPCKHGSHIEWFNNSLDEIHTVAKAWRRWMLSMPYGQLDDDSPHLSPELKIRHLSPEWKACLENVQTQVDRNNWLDWLCQRVPELPRFITKASWDTGVYIEDESGAEVRGSFMRNGTNGKSSLIKRSRTCLV